MVESSLQDRLRDHAKAFDGLLSLIPAKMYYGEDSNTNDQWKKKKQTKAQAAEARRNKLDPDSELNRSVKEVMDDQARKKRKRDEGLGDAEDQWSDVEGVEPEKPGQGLKKKKKKSKIVDDEPELTEKEQRKEEKKQARKARKAERQELRDEEAEYQKRNVKSGVNKIKLGEKDSRPPFKALRKPVSSQSEEATLNQSSAVTTVEEDLDEPEEPAEVQDLDVAGLVAEDEDKHDSASTGPSEPDSPVFDTNGTPADSTDQPPSTTTSVSSTVTPSEKPKHIKIPTDTTALRARLAAKIQALRDARKADGPDGKPIRTRQELIESRRKKQAERKAHKQELRKRAKEEEDQKREEALASARNSPGSILSPAVDLADNNFAFGRVAFGDGAQLSHDLSHILTNGKKKGPSDPKTALQRVQNEKKRLEAMDEEKRKDIEEKETWLVARKRAEGEKIRDDEKLLKKAVKRKEDSKKKSEKAWAERSDGVKKSIHLKQKKREENIKKRRDEKVAGKAGKKKGGAKKGGAKKSKAGRAGFEGSFSVGGKKK